MKVNAGKSKVRVLNREEGLECEVHLDGIRLEHISEVKYLRFILDELGIDVTWKCNGKVASRRKVAGAIRLIVWICSSIGLDSSMRHCLCLFLCIALEQCYGGRRRDLE